MFRHYYDSRMFPFLTDLLFEELFNFDWESSKREIEEKKKNFNRDYKCLEKFCNGKKCDKKRCEEKNAPGLCITEKNLNKNLQFYSPSFKLVDDAYVYEHSIPDVKPGDIEISVADGGFYLSYRGNTENGLWSTASRETLPEDLDVDSMKAVFKNGKLTVTANRVVKKEEPVKDENDDIEFEIEIGK